MFITLIQFLFLCKKKMKGSRSLQSITLHYGGFLVYEYLASLVTTIKKHNALFSCTCVDYLPLPFRGT